MIDALWSINSQYLLYITFIESHPFSLPISSSRRTLFTFAIVAHIPWCDTDNVFRLRNAYIQLHRPLCPHRPPSYRISYSFLFSTMAPSRRVTRSTVDKDLMPNLENRALKASARRYVSFLIIMYSSSTD